MTDSDKFVFEDWASAKLARSKLKDVHPDFRWYQVGWEGEIRTEASVLRFTGCQFRVAKSGKEKGKLSILVKGTDRTAYLSHAEAMECSKQDNSKKESA